MTGLSKYLNYEYKPGARGEHGMIDCWGLVRMVRAEVYGLPWLPEFAEARFGDPDSIQAAYSDQASAMRQVDPREGAIVACLRRGACIHVAVLVNGGRVLEIKRAGARARLFRHSDWLRDYPAPLWEVRYYCEAQP